MDNSMKKNTEAEIREWAEVCIRDKTSSAEKPSLGLWFRRFKPEGYYIAGDKYSAYTIEKVDKIRKIFG